VPLSAGRPLRDLEFALTDLQDQRGADTDAYVRVFLECDGPQPGLIDDVREVLPNAVEIRLVYEREDPTARAAELRRLKPGELFERYFRERYGAPPAETLTKLFGELLEEVVDAPARD